MLLIALAIIFSIALYWAFVILNHASGPYVRNGKIFDCRRSTTSPHSNSALSLAIKDGEGLL